MIRVLEKSVADKIAAGEVVERPVSVVKELVENSIDAGSKNITVEIRQGGRTFIRITDDGMGIPADEVKTAFLRHATSKIYKAEDLNNLITLGFRGEALASIAAVSRIELITKPKNSNLGKKLIIHGGEIIEEASIGCPEGTTIIVSDLFYNTPARSKFLKSDGAESGQIIDFMEKIALTRPDISFKLINNGKNVFSTNGRGELDLAIMSVFKDRDYMDLIELTHETKDVSVYGYISRPQITRTNKRSQYFFVNGRVVKSSLMERALMAGYKERTFEGRYPIAFIFLDVNPGKLDVNIHPNKKEVRFSDEIEVSTAIQEAVVNALSGDRAVGHGNMAASMPSIDEPTTSSEPEYKAKAVREEDGFIHNGPQLSIYDSHEDEKIEDKVDINILFESKRKENSSADNVDDKTFKVTQPINKPFNFDELVFKDAIFDTYIMATDEEYFYLFDQHACHERVNYERFLKEYNQEKKVRQILLLPFTIDVPTHMAADDEEWLKSIENLGFIAEKFGENTYIFREVPQFLTLEEARDFANEFIDAYSEGLEVKRIPDIDRLISRACKSSIKANDHIGKEEIDGLIMQLKSCINPFSCPHGRPTFIRFSLKDIEKMFLRIV